MWATLLLIAPLAALAVGEVPTAYRAGDHDEVSRQARAAGAAGIATLLGSSDRETVLAGIAAAPAAPDAWELLAELAVLAGGWDRSVAAPAARTAARIARNLDGATAISLDMPDDALARRGAAWEALAMRADRWGDVRAHALEVAARVAAARRATATLDPGLGYGLDQVLAEADPELRRAGAELVPMPAPLDAHTSLGAAVIRDPSATVALAAAQALCAEPDEPDGAGDHRERAASRTAVLASLGPLGLERLRALVTAGEPGDAPPSVLLDAARCLIADGSPASVRAVQTLAARGPRDVRRWAALLLRAP